MLHQTLRDEIYTIPTYWNILKLCLISCSLQGCDKFKIHIIIDMELQIYIKIIPTQIFACLK